MKILVLLNIVDFGREIRDASLQINVLIDEESVEIINNKQVEVNLPKTIEPGFYMAILRVNYQDGYMALYEMNLALGSESPPGLQSLIDPQGPPGEKGPAGVQGPPGEKGPTGVQGPPGEKGPTGVQGPAGEKGPIGARGSVGLQGSTGPTGPQGAPGTRGSVGLQGPAGPQGLIGPQGPTGPEGEPGIRGSTGVQGPAGPQGPTGPQGKSKEFKLPDFNVPPSGLQALVLCSESQRPVCAPSKTLSRGVAPCTIATGTKSCRATSPQGGCVLCALPNTDQFSKPSYEKALDKKAAEERKQEEFEYKPES